MSPGRTPSCEGGVEVSPRRPTKSREGIAKVSPSRVRAQDRKVSMCLPVLSSSDEAEPEERVLRERDNVYLEPWMKKKEVLSALQKIVSGMPSRSLKRAGAKKGCKGKSFADQSRKKVDFACIYIVEVPMSDEVAAREILRTPRTRHKDPLPLSVTLEEYAF
jgi:hypothetical protein